MDIADVKPLLEDLESNIDDLEDALNPLCAQALSTAAGKLPLLDKAKLYVLATYALESVLFSILRLHGVEAKSHPIFQELNRVKEYFGKIKSAETAGSKPTSRLDKDAAARFVRHGLAGNDEYDRKKEERRLREKAGAKRRLEEIATGTHTRFNGVAKRIKTDDESQQRHENTVEGADRKSEVEPPVQQKPRSEMTKEEKRAAKLQRRLEARLAKQSPAPSPAASDQQGPSSGPSGVEVSEPERQQGGNIGPRSSHDTFEALLNGPLPQDEEKKSRKKKRKSRGQVQRELEDKRAEEML